MSPKQRSTLATIGGIAGVIATTLAVFAAAGPPIARAVGLPTEQHVKAIVSDTMRAHELRQAAQLDSIKRQADAIRCVIDGDYAQKHEDACRWGLQ